MLKVSSLIGFGSADSGPRITFLASGTGTDSSIEIPGSIAAGDICLIFDNAVDASTPTTVVPTDFTSLVNTFGGVSRHITSAKILTGGETAVTGMTGAGFKHWVAAVFRPSVTYSSLTANSSNDELTNGNPTSQTITASGETNVPILLYGQMYSDIAISPRTTSPTMDEIAGAATVHYAHYKIYNSGPVNHSYDMDDEGALNVLQSGYLDFTV